MATHFCNKWLVLGIDLFMIAVSFFLAYLIRFNFNLNFDISKFAWQLPVVVLIALIFFLITGSYTKLFEHLGALNFYKVFKAIGLTSALLIVLMLINHTWEVYPKFNIPLSIIIIYSLISFLGLSASHYLFKVSYNASVAKNLK